MNDEIKKALEEINILGNTILNDTTYKPTINRREVLYNYITNLQQEIEKLNDDKRGMLVQLYKANDNRDKVKQENERLKEIKPCMLNFQECYVVKDYKSRCEKAIEYIKNDWYELNTLDIEHCINLGKDIRIDLLNILQNGSDDK